MLAGSIYDVHAANPNLSVSAENPHFENHFAGSMVVEVVIRDPRIGDTAEGKGEPDVTINGKILRMIQATDGNWYAYFANVDSAKAADSTVTYAGTGLDFGVFCSGATNSSVFGISLSDTDGFSVPSPSGLTGFSNGSEDFSECHGVPQDYDNHNNVVRKSKSINTNPNIVPGQIGLKPEAWPLVQLFSFSDVVIRYNSSAGLQQVELGYGEIPNISINTDRDLYPQNSQVFLTIGDVQLNQDPTDEDSWTFNVGNPNSVFYAAFASTGTSRGSELADLYPHLSSMGFDDNGALSINTGDILKLKTNSEQPQTFVSDNTRTFSQIVTLVESGPNSGIFDTADHGNESSISVKDDAPRGQAASIFYDKESISVLTGTYSASVYLGKPSLVIGGSEPLLPGTQIPVTLVDRDQNLNSGAKDALDVFRSTAVIPTLKIGNPVTLDSASGVIFFKNPYDEGIPANSSVPDANSSRLFINTSGITGSFEKISFNLGSPASKLHSTLISPSQDSAGTNWLNYDFRAIEKNLHVSDFSDTSIELFFNSIESVPVHLVESGKISSPQGIIQLDDSTVREISSKTGTIFVVINFDDSNDSSDVGMISDDVADHPIILDFFSFGLNGNLSVNNSIYRFELEETSPNSSTFDGTLEFAVANQLNVFDPSFVQSIRTIDDKIKFIVVGGLTTDEGISISYSDLNDVGVITNTSSKSDTVTNSGRIFLDSETYRFGQPVTFTLEDPDLNLNHSRVDVYNVIDDPMSLNVDTVGRNGNVLLEILIKDIRYKRCTVDGKEHGGLAASGFSLVETSASSGVFEGVFKMPSKICNKSGTKLISSAGGNLDAKYYDYRDRNGNQNVFSLSKNIPSSPPHFNVDKVVTPTLSATEEVILSGTVTGHKRGVPLTVILLHPDGTEQTFAVKLTSSGTYKVAFAITGNSASGVYTAQTLHDGRDVGTASFVVYGYVIPEWVKEAAKLWSESSASDSEFIESLRYLVDEKVLLHGKHDIFRDAYVPVWTKDIAGWWAHDQIDDDEFLNSIQFLIKQGIIRV